MWHTENLRCNELLQSSILSVVFGLRILRNKHQRLEFMSHRVFSSNSIDEDVDLRKERIKLVFPEIHPGLGASQLHSGTFVPSHCCSRRAILVRHWRTQMSLIYEIMGMKVSVFSYIYARPL